MGKRKKRLNVLNTQKIFNLSVVDKNDYTLDIKSDNYIKEWESLQEHIKEQDDMLPDRNGISYDLYYDGNYDFSFIRDVVEYGGMVNIITSDVMPDPLIDLMARNDKFSHATYLFKTSYTTREINNIRQAASAVDVNIVMRTNGDDVTAYDIMISLSDLVFDVDNLIIEFNSEDYEKEYKLFNNIRDALSGWKIGIVFLSSNEEEKEYMLEHKAVDEKLKKSSTVWVKD